MPVQFCKLFPGIVLFWKLTQTTAISYQTNGLCESAAQFRGYNILIFLLKWMQISLTICFYWTLERWNVKEKKQLWTSATEIKTARTLCMSSCGYIAIHSCHDRPWFFYCCYYCCPRKVNGMWEFKCQHHFWKWYLITCKKATDIK